MGIEPTERLTDVPLGFEDREEHQHLSHPHRFILIKFNTVYKVFF
ncbi:hypothetical protein DFO73_11667 [Cytobacillus oceanisediminis]|uniref:Uncharacterized protein n=1 Tax=Cytobacillus oceanisediminis TaxID=665099 RepID=A0A2V2ZKS3_9BACI|nr:hypothetical protein DFO73_11667 [Cytobacillus oceanisediminis]